VSRAIRKLVKAGDVEGIIAFIRDAEEKDRAEILDAILACMETHADRVKQLRRPILDVCVPLAKDPVPRVRATAISIATALRDPSAPTLAISALSDTFPAVRMRGLLGVIFLQPSGSLATLLPLLADQDENVRTYAAAALEWVGDRSSLDHLVAAQARESHPLAKKAIDEAISVLEGRRSPHPVEPFMEDPDS
jgi:HEAT repeat protein